MIKNPCLFLILLLSLLSCYLTVAQHTNIIEANLNGDSKIIDIKQSFVYKNTSNDTLNFLYFNDWAHAYSDKNTALAKRFSEEFKKSLHLAKDKDRGATNLTSVLGKEQIDFKWERTSGLDIIKVFLNKALVPGDSVPIFFTYTVKIPPKRYTSYGFSGKNKYYLKDWYLNPAVYDGEWHLYANKNLEDIYTDPTDTDITFIYPKNSYLTSNYSGQKTTGLEDKQQIKLQGREQKNCEIIIDPKNKFTKHVTPSFTIVTDIEASKYDINAQAISINRVSQFIQESLGEFPHSQLLVSKIDYNKNPLYGINQLPKFIRPYNEQFQFELKILKTALTSYLKETIYTDPRKEKWVNGALLNYLMITYVDTQYPDQKLLGKLANIWGFRGYKLSKLKFNDQYAFLHMLIARKNLDQSLVTPNDSLVKFNEKIANDYKSGLGIAYLADYLGKEKVDTSIKSFYRKYSLKSTRSNDFQDILEQSSDEDINWFFQDYVSSDSQIDFKIKKIIRDGDSLSVTLTNKSGTNVPISLFGIQKDTVVSKYWFSDIAKEKTVRIPYNNEKRLVLNYDQKIPEFNQRDNQRRVKKGFLKGNKKLKFQFFKDAEDPYYNQIFYVPAIKIDANDGITPQLRIGNKTLLDRPFVYGINPAYSFNEKTLVGSGGFSYRKFHAKSGFYLSQYSLGGSTSHFAPNSRFFSITPRISFGWRPKDLRSNERQSLRFRWVNIFRDPDPNLADETLDLENNPDYSVVNARFRSFNNNTINFWSYFIDLQYSNEFTKVSFNYEYRKLFKNNRQLNLRFFAGSFLRNDTESDFFSFALDRPTDYLFDLNYLRRANDNSIYNQQIIIAEGGFKSQLDTPFANRWITTINASTNIWRWVEVYGDVGLVKNSDINPVFVYDSGVRLNLVTDFFELYFPVYSNNGFEISEPNYGENIRFIVTISPRTLLRLFNRKWF